MTHPAQLVPHTSAADACWDEMRRRWAASTPMLAEESFVRWPELLEHESTAVDVIYAEFVLSDQYGHRTEPAEYVRRFPQYAAALERQFQMHAALSSTIHPASLTYDSGRQPRSAEAIACPGIWDRYHLVARLSSGGQAEVFRALHPSLEQEVIIKISRAPVAPNSVEAQRILREGQLLAALSHPHIARVFDLGVYAGRPYLVMEYVRGKNLEQASRQRTMSASDASALVAKVARALDVAHRQGIVHLDVKPKNVVLDPAGEPRLIDFGLSWFEDAWRGGPLDDGQLVGTLQFMAPEQARGDVTKIGPASDLFGLGGVLLLLLTGEGPYRWQGFAETMEAARSGKWDRSLLAAPAVPRSLRTIIERALAFEPAERFSRAEEMATALEELATTSQPRPKRLIPVAAITAALVLLSVAALVWRPDLIGNSPAALQQHSGGGARGLDPLVVAPGLRVAVWEDQRFLDLHDVVPLRSGDKIQVRVEVPSGHHATLFLINSAGQVRRLADFVAQQNSAAATFPERADEVVPLTGPPGTEVLLLCCRKDRPLPDSELQSLVPPGAWPQLPDYSLLRMTSGGVSVEQGSKDVGDIEKLPNPVVLVHDHLQAIRGALAPRCGFVEAIAFCHVE